jgi:hypothetical protein
MKGDPRTKQLAVATCNGNVIIFSCDTLTSTWKPIHTVEQGNKVPAVSIDLLLRGENLFVVGYANGQVKIISPEGKIICEI